jgi:hypothetical protein
MGSPRTSSEFESQSPGRRGSAAPCVRLGFPSRRHRGRRPQRASCRQWQCPRRALAGAPARANGSGSAATQPDRNRANCLSRPPSCRRTPTCLSSAPLLSLYMLPSKPCFLAESPPPFLSGCRPFVYFSPIPAGAVGRQTQLEGLAQARMALELGLDAQSSPIVPLPGPFSVSRHCEWIRDPGPSVLGQGGCCVCQIHAWSDFDAFFLPRRPGGFP